jgi:hypothetical protein
MDGMKVITIDRLLIERIQKLEKRMSQLDTDVQALTAAVATLVGVVNQAVEALGTIANESTDDAAVVAANTAIAGLTSSLTAALNPDPAAPTPAAPTS